MLGLAAGNPLVGRLAEGLLEAALEGVDAGVGQGGKLVQAVHLAVVLVDEILEVAVLADERVEEGGQLFPVVIGTQEDEQFLHLHLEEVYAAQAVFEAVAQAGGIFGKALADGQQGELVVETFGDVAGQRLDGEAVAEGDVMGRMEADERARLLHLDVAAAVARLERDVACPVQHVVVAVGADLDLAFEHEDDERFVRVHYLAHAFGVVQQLDGRILWHAVVQAATVFSCILQ